MKVPTKGGKPFRFVKVHKLPWPHDEHDHFFPKAQHVDLFERSKTGAPDELVPGTESFRTRLREIAHSIAEILIAMRRRGERVFIATPAEDVSGPETRLRDELLAQGYDVQPTGRLDKTFEDEAVEKALERARLSIHLLGASYDVYAEHLAELAYGLSVPRVVWLSREAETSPSPKQRDWIERLLRGAGNGSHPTTLTGLESRMRENIQELLVPRPEEASPLTSEKKRSIYILCDTSSPGDTAASATLSDQIRAAEDVEIFLPATATSSRGLVAAHEQRLRECEDSSCSRTRHRKRGYGTPACRSCPFG